MSSSGLPASRPRGPSRCARSGVLPARRASKSLFGAAASLAQAYLSDGLNAVAGAGVPLFPSFIDGAGAKSTRSRISLERNRPSPPGLLMPGPDPAHWLHRLTAAEWLAAAENELALAEAALARRAFRPGVTHARRAAGMAWNAVLVAMPDDDRYGRSYMDHVHALGRRARTCRTSYATPPSSCGTPLPCHPSW